MRVWKYVEKKKSEVVPKDNQSVKPGLETYTNRLQIDHKAWPMRLSALAQPKGIAFKFTSAK